MESLEGKGGGAEKSTWEKHLGKALGKTVGEKAGYRGLYEIRFCEKSLWAKMEEAGPAIGCVVSF